MIQIDPDDLSLIAIAKAKEADSPAFEQLIIRCKSREARSRIRKILHLKWIKYKLKLKHS